MNVVFLCLPPRDDVEDCSPVIKESVDKDTT